MDISPILKIATIGILIAVLDKILTSLGKQEQATVVTLAGLVIVLTMVISMISKLFASVKTMFQF